MVLGEISVLLMFWLLAAIGMWAVAAFTASLYQADWSVTLLTRQYLEASGLTAPVTTLVDYSSHCKGIEYLICAAFCIAFPLFHHYINGSKRRESTRN